ncbi:MAG: DJ-1/PfpI family protein [Ktedonobacteraceae bacterium]
MAAQSSQVKGKIGVLIEAHFDETEFRRFNEFFPAHGYEVEYITHLWGQDKLTFKGNDFTQEVTVTREVSDVKPADYKAIILIGGYAMDRLRYQEHPEPGRPNRAPAVEFLRRAVKAMNNSHLKIGTICHSLWLFCAAPETLTGRKVTCAHNIMGDVENAGGTLVFYDDQLIDTYVDGNLITGRHPGVVEAFMKTLLEEIEKLAAQPVM